MTRLTFDGAVCVFVYGSLKRGHENHNAFCAGYREVVPATIRGRLYRQRSGYPMLVVPREDVVALGTGDPRADASLLARLAAPPNRDVHAAAGADGLWQLVQGEILTFDDPEHRLPRLDTLEAFHPARPSLYHRAIVPARHVTTQWVWTYIAPDGELPAGALPMAAQWP